MLSRTVHSIERLFMENYPEMVFFSHFLHKNHQHHVLIDSLCSLTEERSTLELIRSYLVMTCLKKNAQFVGFCLEILHE